MADVKAAWNETGEALNSLGLKLKLHYEQQRGGDADATRAEVEDAVKRLTETVKDAFEALGSAAHDPAVKADAQQVGQSLVQALNATFEEVRKNVRRPGDQPPAG